MASPSPAITPSVIPFVDAHVHMWDLGRIRYPWLTAPFDDSGPNGSTEAIARDYLPEQYRAHAAKWHMVGCVHVDAGAVPDQALEETRWLEALNATSGLPSGIVAYAALEQPGAEALLAAQAAHPHVRGIRQIVNWHPDPRRSYTPRDLTRDEAWAQGFARLGRHGLSFDLQCYPGQMAGLAPLIARHPVPVIINHLGMPVLSDPDGLADWRKGLRALAGCANVAIKISGLGFIDRNWTPEGMAPLLRETVDLFGPARCLFASDTPTDTLFAPFDAYLAAYHAFAAPFSEDERRAMFGGNANRIYRLGLAL